MDFTDLMSELTKPMLPTKALAISFLVFLSICIAAIIFEKLNFTILLVCVRACPL